MADRRSKPVRDQDKGDLVRSSRAGGRERARAIQNPPKPKRKDAKGAKVCKGSNRQRGGAARRFETWGKGQAKVSGRVIRTFVACDVLGSARL
jgi:hypothetical protein